MISKTFVGISLNFMGISVICLGKSVLVDLYMIFFRSSRTVHFMFLNPKTMVKNLANLVKNLINIFARNKLYFVIPHPYR